MNREELNTALYEKMEKEQNTFRDWLKDQSPEDVLNHAYEYIIREDIVAEMGGYELTEAQAKALLASPTPLADVFTAFQKMETNHMDAIRDCLDNRADYVIRQEQEKLRSTPLYRQSGQYARDHNELEEYRASYQANVACKEAIEKAIGENYADNRLNSAAVYADVVGSFGVERVKLVLANTIQHKDWDERFSRENRAWAHTVPMEVCFGLRENDHSVYYVVDKTHTGLTDLFVTHFRKELEKERAQPKRESILGKIHAPLPEPTAATGKDHAHER